MDEQRSRRAVDGGGWWDDLGTWARVSLAGIAVAGILAVILGFFITRQVQDRFLMAEVAADQQVVDFLTNSAAISMAGEPDPVVLDAFVAPALRSGAFTRVKLWSPEGTILYSDEPRLIGRTFETDEHFPSLLEPRSVVADLEAEENVFETELADSLLETYVPVVENGAVVAVWEVYRPLDDFNAAVRSTRWIVFLTVGGGLFLLGISLVSAFGALIAAAQRRRHEAEDRSADLAQLLDLAQTAAIHHRPSELARAAVAQLARRGLFECIALLRHEPNQNAVQIASAGNCDCLEPGSSVLMPARALSKDGDLELLACGVVGPHADTVPMLEAAVEEISIGLQKATLYEDLEANRAQLQSVMDMLVSAQEDERRRLVADIHDGLAQDLYRVLFGIRGCIAAGPGETGDELEDLEQLVEESSKRLRQLLQTIHPSIVEDLGLRSSLRTLAEQIEARYGLQVAPDLSACPEADFDTSMAAYRVSQEALVNAAKHSGADTARLSASVADGQLLVVVEDDGSGFDPGATPGLGVWLMRERSERLGGSVDIVNSDRGTKVTCYLPLKGSS